MTDRSYVPPLRFPQLTTAYDRLIALTLPEAKLKRRLVEQAAIAPGHVVLDLGCGTGTLTIMIQQAQPAADVVGIDADEAALSIARRKAAAVGANVTFRRELAQDIALAPASVDRVLSSLFFHHLLDADKIVTFQKLHVSLRPGGELHVLDWVPLGTP